MPEQQDAEREIFGTGKGRTLLRQALKRKAATLEKLHTLKPKAIPPYQATNPTHLAFFRALKWDRKMVERFWVNFCEVNTSRDGEIKRDEFLHYFGLTGTPYVNKCFSFFDTTDGGTIDFLEFILSVWSVCTMKHDSLTNFVFDLFDLDSDGELSFPEIETMLEELFGEDGVKSGTGKEVLDDIALFAEKRGGSLRLMEFTVYTAKHQLLLFPIFQIQRSIQRKVMGEKYWLKVERRRLIKKDGDSGNSFDPRHFHTLLRTHNKPGTAAPILTDACDADEVQRAWFCEKKRSIELPLIQQGDNERAMNQTRTRRLKIGLIPPPSIKSVLDLVMTRNKGRSN